MYIHDKRVKFLKVKNLLLMMFSGFEFIFSVAYIAYMSYHYWGDWFTLKRCASMPESIFWVFVAPLLFAHAVRSNKRIGDAYFFCSYFEGSLSGIIEFQELADITGYTNSQIENKMRLFKKVYMKNYELQEIDRNNKIILNSKKVECSCKSCGAPIEKSVYFTGNCSYCGSMDLHAKILTDSRFYCISNAAADIKNKPDVKYNFDTQNISDAKNKSNVKNKSNTKSKSITYKNPRNNMLMSLFLVAMGIAILFGFIGFCMGCEAVAHANDHDYIIKQILAGEIHCSSEEAAREFIGDAMFSFGLFLLMLPVPFFMIKRVLYLQSAEKNAAYLNTVKKPFADLNKMPTISAAANKPKSIHILKESICHDYLMNCSFEKHDDGMKIGLSKKIVRDACPHCSAPIKGAVDENYTCSYCGNVIMGVVVHG